jgi:hypothetical protein
MFAETNPLGLFILTKGYNNESWEYNCMDKVKIKFRRTRLFEDINYQPRPLTQQVPQTPRKAHRALKTLVLAVTKPAATKKILKACLQARQGKPKLVHRHRGLCLILKTGHLNESQGPHNYYS